MKRQLRSGRVGHRSADVRLRVFLLLKNKELAVGVMVAFDLGAAFGTKVHEDGNGELGRTEVAEGLVVFLLCQLRDGFALDDDVTYR